jgi:hypothetical protein
MVCENQFVKNVIQKIKKHAKKMNMTESELQLHEICSYQVQISTVDAAVYAEILAYNYSSLASLFQTIFRPKFVPVRLSGRFFVRLSGRFENL